MAADISPSHHFSRGKLSLAVSTACASVAPVAVAQAQGTSDVLRIEEIIVTATKREMTLQEVPMAITAFTDQDIVRAGFKQLDDYVGHIPSMATATREPGGNNVVMRGCATSGVAFGSPQSTAVYLDEQPISVAGANADPRLVDIERVEALSGPQGTLFGDSSQCGTLRIITNKPDPDEFDAWVDLGAVSVTDGDTGFDVSAMVNIPIADGKAALRFVGFRAEEPGFIDNVFADSPAGTAVDGGGTPIYPGGAFDNAEFVEDDINDSTTTGVRAALRIAPSDNWKLDLQFNYQESEATGFGDVDLQEDFLAADSLGEREQIRYGRDFHEDEWYQVSLGLEASLGIGELTVSATFMNREDFYSTDASVYIAAFQDFYPYYALYDFSNDTQAMAFDGGEEDRFSLEVRLATPADSDSRWSGVIGAFYNKSEDHGHFSSNVRILGETPTGAYYYMNNIKATECRGGTAMVPGYYAGYYYTVCPSYYYDATSNSVGGASLSNKWWDGVYNDDLEQVAIFGEATFDISEHFALTVGGRYFDIQTDRTKENGGLVPTSTPFTVQGPEISCDPTGTFTPSGTEITDALCWTGVRNIASSDESGFVPKVTLTYSPNDDNMFYGTYSEGFRRGGGNTSKRNSLFSGPPFDVFESDLVKNFEIGTKNTFADGRLQLNVTAYQMTWEDMQIEVEDPTPGIFALGIVNLAEGEITGVEVFAHWLAAERTSITANIGYNDAEIAEDDTIFEGSDAELFIIKGSRLPLSPDWKVSVVFEHEFNNQILGATPNLGITYRYTGDSINTLGGISSTAAISDVRTQDAYSVTDFRLGLANDSWSANLFIHNAFDEYASLYFNERWIQTRLTVNRPRTVGINFRKNY